MFGEQPNYNWIAAIYLMYYQFGRKNTGVHGIYVKGSMRDMFGNLHFRGASTVVNVFNARPKTTLDREQMCIDMGYVSADSMSRFEADDPSLKDTYVRASATRQQRKETKRIDDIDTYVKYWIVAE